MAVAASRRRLVDLTTRAAAGAIDLVFFDEPEALTHPYLERRSHSSSAIPQAA